MPHHIHIKKNRMINTIMKIRRYFSICMTVIFYYFKGISVQGTNSAFLYLFFIALSHVSADFLLVQ
jgi:hypothetical protein